MLPGWCLGSRLRERLTVQGGIQDLFDAPVLGIAKVECAGTSCLQPLSPYRLFQTQDGLACTERRRYKGRSPNKVSTTWLVAGPSRAATWRQ